MKPQFHSSLRALAWLAGALMLLQSCKTDEAVSPTTPGKPGTPIEQPNPDGGWVTLPVVPSFRTIRLDWSETDFRETTYDADFLPTRQVAQALHVQGQGTNQVVTTTRTFHYDARKRLERVDLANSFGGNATVRYTYDGETLAKTETFAATGRLMTTRQYAFSPANQLLEMAETDVETSGKISAERLTRYEYDGRGNLKTERVFFKNNAGQFELDHSTVFGDYDNQNAADFPERTPDFLPHVRMRVNNPGSNVSLGKNGQPLRAKEMHQYTYDEKGYPTSRTTIGAGGTLTVRFTYR